MKQVPFYANHPDGMMCSLAVYGMVVEHFEDKHLNWGELTEITGYQPKKAAWTVKPLVYFAKHGYDIRMIEPFDYKGYLEQGEKYLTTLLKPYELKWQLENTNLLEITSQIPEFIATINHIQRTPTLEDIDEMLADGYLVNVMLDSGALNGKETYVAHAILVIDKNNDNYVAHDPGGSSSAPKPYREISPEKLLLAMGGVDNNAEVTGLKRG